MPKNKKPKITKVQTKGHSKKERQAKAQEFQIIRSERSPHNPNKINKKQAGQILNKEEKDRLVNLIDAVEIIQESNLTSRASSRFK